MLFPKYLAFVVFLVSGGAIAMPAQTLLTGPLDFSRTGYAGGGVGLPLVPGVFEVAPTFGDDTPAIQAALDAVARLSPAASGFRGAVVLRPGTYRIEGQLRIRASGIVLRGQSATLVAAGHSRRTLIDVRGEDDRVLSPALGVTDDTVPVGRAQLSLSAVESLRVGDRVVVQRPSTKAWIDELGMTRFVGPVSSDPRYKNFKDLRLDWWPGSRDIEWERTIVAVDEAARSVTLNLPLTTTLDQKFGGGTIRTFSWPGRLQNVGIENLSCVSEFNPANPMDEEHAWICISVENTENVWVRGITARHFVSSAVWVGAKARAVTVEDCASEEPVSELGGWRRISYYVGGQQVLVQRCTADDGWSDFVTGHCAAGPNVFLDCQATRAHRDSGGFESWASGTLYDNVRIQGAALALVNLGEAMQGAGWTAANSVAWNCSATGGVQAESPPGAVNATVTDGGTASLYRAQLASRAGTGALSALAQSRMPADSETLPTAALPLPPAPPTALPLSIVDGKILIGGRPVFSNTAGSNAIWQGQLMPIRAALLQNSPTRWAPGRVGPGLTEDLDALTDRMRSRDTPIYELSPPLWYDRRRDEHSATVRKDSDVWAPFLEQPWARSGIGQAWDGLSKYDLTKFNPWYWDRVREMAKLAGAKGLILEYYFYQNHGLMEKAAHWSDLPWDQVNCLQDTGVLNPPPKDGEMFYNPTVALRFYDITNPTLRELHRLYIWHGLDVLAGEPNVIYSLGWEFDGPLPFEQFFLDTVAEWERAHHRRLHLQLSTSKAMTDAILTDPVRAGLVDTINMRYWQYLPDGTLYAPDGQGKRAFRELRVAYFKLLHDAPVPHSTPDLVYKLVREYHDRSPGRALIGFDAGVGPIPILMAGGAGTLLEHGSPEDEPRATGDYRAFYTFVNGPLASALGQMNPRDNLTTDGSWCLADTGLTHLLIDSRSGSSISLARPLEGAPFTALWFDVANKTAREFPLRDLQTIAKPTAGEWLLFLARADRN
jgi:hypothetical protein